MGVLSCVCSSHRSIALQHCCWAKNYEITCLSSSHPMSCQLAESLRFPTSPSCTTHTQFSISITDTRVKLRIPLPWVIMAAFPCPSLSFPLDKVQVWLLKGSAMSLILIWPCWEVVDFEEVGLSEWPLCHWRMSPQKVFHAVLMEPHWFDLTHHFNLVSCLPHDSTPLL